MPAEPTVTLTLSQSQFRTLVEMTYISHWVVCAGEDVADAGYRVAVEAVEQKIFEEGVRQGMKDLIDDNTADEEKFDRLFPTRYLEENSKARKALIAHENEMFWEELVYRLADIFAEREVGTERWNKMGQDKRVKASWGQEDRLRDLFAKQGLDAIFLMSEAAAG